MDCCGSYHQVPSGQTSLPQEGRCCAARTWSNGAAGAAVPRLHVGVTQPCGVRHPWSGSFGGRRMRYEHREGATGRLCPVPAGFPSAVHLHGGGARPAGRTRPARPRLLHPPADAPGARPRDPLGRGSAPDPARRRYPGPGRLHPGQALRPPDGPGRLALVGQASCRRQRHQPVDPGVDGRRPPRPLRLSDLRQGPRRFQQERLVHPAVARRSGAASARSASASTVGTAGWRT